MLEKMPFDAPLLMRVLIGTLRPADYKVGQEIEGPTCCVFYLSAGVQRAGAFGRDHLEALRSYRATSQSTDQHKNVDSDSCKPQQRSISCATVV